MKHDFRHHAGDIAAMHGRFLEDAGAQKDPAQAGHEKHRLEFRFQPPVHHGQLKFVLEIGNGPETPQDGPGFLARGVFYQQAVEGVNGDHGVIRQGHPAHLHPLFDGKQGLLKGVGGHRHDDPVKDLQGSLDQVHVAVGDGVE